VGVIHISVADYGSTQDSLVVVGKGQFVIGIRKSVNIELNELSWEVKLALDFFVLNVRGEMVMCL